MRTRPIESNKRKASDDPNDREEKKLRLTLNEDESSEHDAASEKPDDAIPDELEKLFGSDNLQQLILDIKNHLQNSYRDNTDYFSLQDMVLEQLPGWPANVLLSDIYLKLYVYLMRKYLFDFLVHHPEISRVNFSEFRYVGNYFDFSASAETLELLLQACPHIKELNVSNMSIFAMGSPALRKLISIPSLIFNSVNGANHITFGLCAVSGSASRVVNLGMRDAGIKDEHIDDIVRIRSLRTLDLSGNSVCDKGAAKIAKMKNLTRLILSGCLIGRLGFKALLSNHNITYLDLSGNIVDNDALYALANEITENKHIAREFKLENVWHEGALEPLVEAMKKNSVVILRGINNQKINFMTERNILLKKYPEYASYIKRIFHQHGLYVYQSDELSAIQNLNIYTEPRRREFGKPGNAEALAEIKEVTSRLQSSSLDVQSEEERRYAEFNRF
jgi:hypothetical protein